MTTNNLTAGQRARLGLLTEEISHCQKAIQEVLATGYTEESKHNLEIAIAHVTAANGLIALQDISESNLYGFIGSRMFQLETAAASIQKANKSSDIPFIDLFGD